MSDQLRKITELMEQDPEFKGKLQALNDDPSAGPADFVVLAGEYGISLTEADFVAPVSPDGLTDDELEAVTGGDCGCAIGGGGAGGASGTCACVLAGLGSSGPGVYTCMCGIAGGG